MSSRRSFRPRCHWAALLAQALVLSAAWTMGAGQTDAERLYTFPVTGPRYTFDQVRLCVGFTLLHAML